MDKYLRPCIAEMIGTFLLCFIGGGVICMSAVAPSSGLNLLAIALAHGLILSIAVTATMNVSGGHVNPAVTLTMYVLGKIDTTQMFYYVIFQLLGGVIAGFFLTVIFGSTMAATDPSVALGTPHITGLRDIIKDDFLVFGILDRRLVLAIVVEMVLTFVLVFAVFGTAVDPRAPKIGGFGVGLAITCDILVGGPLTGAAMNPARYFGTGIWEAGINADFGRLRDFAVYIVGPVLGGILAGWVYTKYVMPPEPKVEKK